VILRLPAIFLDFDGVLHTESQVSRNPFHQLPLLESAFEGVICDVQIVISSSWRFHYPLEDLKRYVRSLSEFVVGTTPEIPPCSFMRYHEIMEVVQTHGLVKWIAIDDAKAEFPDGCENLLHCNPRFGFDLEQHRKLVEWLKAI